ncbi:hypothetical protein GGU11DRAFT_756415 [Lentinula aff. detonsa]|nr:hypothetical protein GGU11DRAFT_756415 [Lentinula aff. detonsa]
MPVVQMIEREEEGAEGTQITVLAATKTQSKGAFLPLRNADEVKWIKQEDRMEQFGAAWGSEATLRTNYAEVVVETLSMRARLLRERKERERNDVSSIWEQTRCVVWSPMLSHKENRKGRQAQAGTGEMVRDCGQLTLTGTPIETPIDSPIEQRRIEMIEKRKEGQRHAHAIFSMDSGEDANELLTGRVVVQGQRITTHAPDAPENTGEEDRMISGNGIGMTSWSFSIIPEEWPGNVLEGIGPRQSNTTFDLYINQRHLVKEVVDVASKNLAVVRQWLKAP